MTLRKYINSNERVDMYDIWRIMRAMKKENTNGVNIGQPSKTNTDLLSVTDKTSKKNTHKTDTDKQNDICSYLVTFLAGCVVGFVLLYGIIGLYLKL